jgi:hypothetical protein
MGLGPTGLGLAGLWAKGYCGPTRIVHFGNCSNGFLEFQFKFKLGLNSKSKFVRISLVLGFK